MKKHLKALTCALAMGMLLAGTAGAQEQAKGAAEQTPTTLHLISDLHIGGAAGLDVCEFEKELIAFLRRIAEGPSPAELIIAGDAFGMWELPDLAGEAKVPEIASKHPRLFEQFRETGRRVKITLIPGNHDYELACVPACREQLAAYNMRLEPVTHLIRQVAGRKLWIEHGNQRDSFNRFPDFGNPYGLPEGYFITRHFVVAAAESAGRGRSPWLDDLESVYPTEDIPFWIWSNYFYNEMSPLLRWFLLPFLCLFTVSAIALAGKALENWGILRTKFFHMHLGARLGLPGRLADWVLWADGVVVTLLLVLTVPAWLLARDMRATLLRYGVDTAAAVRIQKEERYIAAAKTVFEQDPSVAVFIYGHTHAASLRRIGPRAVINTGTWLKRLERVASRFWLLPDIYVPSNRLSCFTISPKGKDIRIEYSLFPKKPPRELSLLQRLVILGRYRPEGNPIPPETILPGDGAGEK